MAEYIYPALDGELGSSTRAKLDGVEYVIQLLWLSEAPRIPRYAEDAPPPPVVLGDPGVWVLTLAQSDGTVLIAGQALRHGVNVLAPYKGDARFPGGGAGRLLAWDSSGDGNDPGREDLDPGSSVRLVYLTAAEA